MLFSKTLYPPTINSLVMYKPALVLLISLFSFPAFAQKDSARYVHRHLLRAQATISPGLLLDWKIKNIYIHGNLEYYADETVSLRGDGYYFVSNLESRDYFKMHHSLFSGASYHIKTKNHFDPYMGIQPGVSITQAIYHMCPPDAACLAVLPAQQSKPSINPLLSGVIGFNYYAQKIFHLFAEARYIHGTHLSDLGPLQLNEVRVSFGLGFNIL